MTDERATGAALPPLTREQFDQALDLLLRHTRGAPTAHFGDSRERTGYIAGRVHRLTDAELGRQMSVYRGMCHYEDHMRGVDRSAKTDLYDVAHALRGEINRRKK